MSTTIMISVRVNVSYVMFKIALFSSLVFTIVLGSQQPSGIVYGDNRQWSLQYSNSVRIL